jgi:Uri superfamily endonuclease
MHPGFDLISVACAHTQDHDNECRIAGLLTIAPINDFGCSDCACRSHLGYFRTNPENEIKSAFSHIGLTLSITKLNISYI